MSEPFNIPSTLTPEELLASGAEQIGVDLSPPAQALLMRYLSLLQRWNRVHNLTRVIETRSAIIYHLLDSLTLVRELSTMSNHIQTLADIGSGMGCPGVVIAICCPSLEVHLIDRNQKKCIFLHHVSRQLGLDNISVCEADISSQGDLPSFDVLVSRATADLGTLSDWCQDLLPEHGMLYAMVGQRPTENAEPKTLSIDTISPVEVPFLNAERHIVTLRK